MDFPSEAAEPQGGAAVPSPSGTPPPALPGLPDLPDLPDLAALPGLPDPAVPGLPDPASLPAAAPQKKARGRKRRWIACASLIVLGTGSAAAGGILLIKELGRPATSVEAAGAARLEVASRWRRLAAGEVFPSAIEYSDGEGLSTTARLVGIAPPGSCAASLDPPVEQALRARGCVTVLRATYVDASGTLVATVGVAVLRSASGTEKAVLNLGDNQPRSGVRAVSFSGTVANAFAGRQRLEFGVEHKSGPYIFFYTVGYADGRVSKSAILSSDLVTFGYGIMARVEHALTSHKSPCTMKDIRC